MSDMEKYELRQAYENWQAEWQTTHEWIDALADQVYCDADVVALLKQRDDARNEISKLKQKIDDLIDSNPDNVFVCEVCGTEWTETKPAVDKSATCNHGDNCPLCNGKCREEG